MNLRTMKIRLSVDSRGWVADLIELPGSPKIGIGKSKEEAIISLLVAHKKIKIVNEK